jgi:hypothetical protein
MRSVTMRIKRILLKLVEDILTKLSYPFIKRTGSITGLSIYQAIVPSVLDNGIEMSMGFDKST